ncbi:hypothetical protein [Flavobacterium chungangensis]|uniref:Lipoprotein n=1 Tax=Flavobacterium chungangensis TaxID=2708132 RepID=A0ABV8ZAJ0_9FLAO
MKTKLLFGALLLFFTLSSCKNEVLKEESTEGKDNFSVVIEGVFEKNDKLQVFYLLDGQDWSEENSLAQAIYASKDMQKIELDFPKNIKLKNVRVDLGFNPTQSYVTIKNISLKYKNEIIDGDLEGYILYFTPNEFVTWDPNYFGYKLNTIDNKYDPFMIGNELFMDKLAIMTEKKEE